MQGVSFGGIDVRMWCCLSSSSSSLSDTDNTKRPDASEQPVTHPSISSLDHGVQLTEQHAPSPSLLPHLGLLAAPPPNRPLHHPTHTTRLLAPKNPRHAHPTPQRPRLARLRGATLPALYTLRPASRRPEYLECARHTRALLGGAHAPVTKYAC